MAGGVGSRFWPRSREKYPKQLLKIFGNDTMIQATVKRLKGFVKDENILIITNKFHQEEIINQLPDIKIENVIAEPFGRNTAPCIGLASAIISSKCKDAVSIVLPADHLIQDEEEFRTTLKIAVEFAYESKGLVTIGINPTRPETGYGYIQITDEEKVKNIFKVRTFAEKPNYLTAVKFIESGDFFWNSGMFIWRVDVILEEISAFIPDLSNGIKELIPAINTDMFNPVLNDVYGKVRNISIDYGVMEKSQRVYLVKGNFSWSDVGSWEEVYALSEKDEKGNSITGKVYTDLTMDSLIYSPNKFTAVIGLDNVIVINTEDSLLVCRRDRAQDVKKIVDYLKLNHHNEYL